MQTPKEDGLLAYPAVSDMLGDVLRDLVLGAISNSVIVCDATAPDQPIVWINEAFERTTGYTAAEVIGRNCRFLQGHGTDRSAIGTMHRAIAAGRGCTVTLLNYRKDGSPFWQELSIAPVRNDAGVLTHFVGVQTDLTAQKRAEEQMRKDAEMRAAATAEAARLAAEAQRLTEAAKRLAEDAQSLAEERLRFADERRQLAEQAQRDAERGQAMAEAAMHLRNEVLANVMHDIRSPLTVLRGRVEMIQQRLSTGRETTEAWLGKQIDTMQTAVTRIAGTLEELSDVAQLWIGQELLLHREMVDLGAIVRAVVAEHQDGNFTNATPIQETPTEIRCEIAHGVAVHGDGARLTRVFENLLSNAVKYGNHYPVQVSLRADGDRATVTIADQGVGIPANELPFVFTRFYRASTARSMAGTGIGLAGAKEIVEQHGGTITLTSTAGHGTVVTVTLPCTTMVETMN